MYQEQQFTKKSTHTGVQCGKTFNSCRSQSSSAGNYAYQDSCGPRSAAPFASVIKPMQFVNEFGKFAKGKGKKGISYDRPKSDSVLRGAEKPAVEGELPPSAAYHHVVSFNKLAAFWDCLIKVANNGDITDLQQIMLQVAELYFKQMQSSVVMERDYKPKEHADESFLAPDGITIVTKSELREFIGGLSRNTFFQAESADSPVKLIKADINEGFSQLKLEGKDKQMLDLIAMMYTWMPFNLVHGSKNRKDDPEEEFDQAAAELTGQPEQYVELMFLMKQYENAKERKDQIAFIEKIGTIIGLNASVEMFEAMDSPAKDGEPAKAVFADKDSEVKSKLIDKFKSILAEKEKEPKKATKKAISAQTANLAYLKRLTGEKAKVSDLQEADFNILYAEFIGKNYVGSNLQRVQSAVDNAIAGVLEGTSYRVAYGSGAGNNCFFYALEELGFNRLGGVEGMRMRMNDLRQPAAEEAGGSETIKAKGKEDSEKVDAEADEIYHPGGMITEMDIQLFAQSAGITVHLYTVIGGVLQPAGVFPYGGEIFHIVHQGNHYMPMHPNPGV